ncbi:hypothetical protein JCM3765_004972 [Sporobolomyces pararoseus]
MVRTYQSNANKPTRVYVSQRSKGGGGTASPRRKLVRGSRRSSPVEESEEEDSNQALLNATEETNFSLSLRISSKYGKPTNYDPIEFEGCQFEDGSIGWKTGQMKLLERVPISYLEGKKGRRTKGAVPCTLFAYVVINDTMPKDTAKRREAEYREPAAAEESSDSVDEQEEDSEEEEEDDAGSAPEISRSTINEQDEIEGEIENEASSPEEEEVKSEDDDISVDSLREHTFFKAKSKAKRRGRRSEIVGGQLDNEDESDE